jgi:hypothetical protein
MSLAATGALTSAALAAVHTTAAESAIAVSSYDQNASESSFAMADSFPQYKILPVTGGLWKPVDSVEGDATTVLGYRDTDQALDSAAMYLTGSGAAVLSILLVGFLAMSFSTRTKSILAKALRSLSNDTKQSSAFVPFVRRGDDVSPYNPVRIGGEEIPGKAVNDPEALSQMFGKKGIQ